MSEKTERSISMVTSILVLASMIVGATLWVGTHIASLQVAMGHGSIRQDRYEEQMKKFAEFANRGDRFTRRDGDKLDARISSLEQWTQAAPPEWFRDMVNELKGDVRLLGAEIDGLSTEIKDIQIRKSQTNLD